MNILKRYDLGAIGWFQGVYPYMLSNMYLQTCPSGFRRISSNFIIKNTVDGEEKSTKVSNRNDGFPKIPSVLFDEIVVPAKKRTKFKMKKIIRKNPAFGANLVGGFTNPIWKICSSKWVHLPQGSGWKFKKYMKPPPRSDFEIISKNPVPGDSSRDLFIP